MVGTPALQTIHVIEFDPVPSSAGTLGIEETCEAEIWLGYLDLVQD